MLEKVVRLADLLLEFGRHPLLRDALLLKGGTPLNLAFGPPRRLSVDLDFNYVGAEDRGAMLSARPEIEGAIRRIAAVRTYAVQQSADQHAGRKLYLGYRNTAGVADRIEVDINYLHRVPLAAPVEAITAASASSAHPTPTSPSSSIPCCPPRWKRPTGPHSEMRRGPCSNPF